MLMVKKDFNLENLSKYGFKKEVVTPLYKSEYFIYVYTPKIVRKNSRRKENSVLSRITIIGGGKLPKNVEMTPRRVMIRGASNEFYDLLFDMINDGIIYKIDDKQAEIERLEQRIRELKGETQNEL